MMKTKVVPVEPLSSYHIFESHLGKHELNQKIEHRLSILHKYRKLSKRHDSSLPLKKYKSGVPSSKKRTAKKRSIFVDENVTGIQLVAYIDSAMKLQQTASEAAIATNRTYEVQLLLIFLEAFIAFIFNCYYMISAITEPETFKLPQKESIGFLLQHLLQPSLCVIVTIVCFATVSKELQQNASEAAIATNRAHEVQLLLIFLEAIIAIIFTCYHIIALMTEPASFKLSQTESFACLLQQLFQPCICVMATVLGFAKLTYEFRRSQSIVNKIIIHAGDKETRIRFSAFSQQIQSNIPRFNIFGFFNLDGSVIFSMISSTTTFLIILVQTLGGGDEDERNVPDKANKVNKTA